MAAPGLSHSLQLDGDLPGLPCQVAHVPVAVEVRDQPERQEETDQSAPWCPAVGDPPAALKDLLDFLRSVVSELVGSGHVPLGPVDVLAHVPAADHHNVLSLLFVLKGRGGR